MKRFISIVLIMTLFVSIFAVSSIQSFAAESGENTKIEEKTSAIRSFLKDVPLGDKLLSLLDTVLGYCKQLVRFIRSNETYKNIATAVLAVLAFLAIPILLGVLVVVYAAIGAMVVFAGALTAVAEIFLGMVPKF